MSHFPESLLTHLYNKAEHGILVFNPNVVYANNSASKIFGFDPVGKSISELLGSDFMFITPSGNDFEFTFDIIINNEWYKIISHTSSGQTVLVLCREINGVITTSETTRECTDLYASMRGSASVISLIADSLHKSNPEDADKISQIQHNCCQLSKDIGMLSSLGSEHDERETCRFDSMLTSICSEANPLVSRLGAELRLSKPICAVHVKMSPGDAEKLVYSILTIVLNIIASEENNDSKPIEISLNKTEESVILQIKVKCSYSANEYIMLSNLNTDIPGRPVSYRKNLNFIKKLAKKHSISIVLGRDSETGCSFTVRFNPAQTGTDDVFMQYDDNGFKTSLTTALVGLSDVLPNTSYSKI